MRIRISRLLRRLSQFIPNFFKYRNGRNCLVDTGGAFIEHYMNKNNTADISTGEVPQILHPRCRGEGCTSFTCNLLYASQFILKKTSRYYIITDKRINSLGLTQLSGGYGWCVVKSYRTVQIFAKRHTTAITREENLHRVLPPLQAKCAGCVSPIVFLSFNKNNYCSYI